jgi:hypothetical protein
MQFIESNITGPRIWEPQRTYNWHFLMPETIGSIDGVQVSQYCQSVTFGDYSFDSVSEIKAGATKRFYAGIQTINTVDCMFIYPATKEVYNYFEAWHELIIDKDGYYSPKNNYKKMCHLILTDRGGKEAARINFKGVFPTNRPVFDNLAYDSEDVVKLTVKFSVDKIEFSNGGELPV